MQIEIRDFDTGQNLQIIYSNTIPHVRDFINGWTTDNKAFSGEVRGVYWHYNNHERFVVLRITLIK